MADLYSVLPVNSEPKYGLGLLPTDLETFHFPSLCQDLVTEQLLTLDNSQSFFLACPDAGEFGAYGEALSRTSTAVTPQSECSTRTSHSARNISPTSDVLSFRDQPAGQDIEAMYHDTTQAIVSGRQSRAVSATWPSTNSSHMGLSSTLTPPARTVTHRPQSFSYRTPQVSQQGSSTPPPPSSFFPSPSLPSQPMAARSPFASPSLQSTMTPQVTHASAPNHFMQANMMPTLPAYYAQQQPQSTSVRQLPQQFQQSPNLAFQQQLQQQQFQQQALSLQQSESRRHSIQAQIQAQIQSAANLFSQPPNNIPSNSLYQPTTTTQPSVTNTAATPPTLPNTTGNSATGYQCFSHGCGGRHFSNWGNLVRHHRERQLRSKAGAKPTCPRCGKGFTRSSARDAHVAGLKCVLGRRRRGANAANGTGTATAYGQTSTDSSGGDAGATGTGLASSQAEEGGATGVQRARNNKDSVNARDHDDTEHDHGSEGSRDDSGEDEDEDDIEMLGSKPVYDDHDSFLVDDAFGLGGSVVDAGRSYLAPQQLHFER